MNRNTFFIIIILLALLSCRQNDIDIRTRYFPKIIQKADNLPQKENVWVFILAGQSNMAGRGLVEPQDTIPSDRIFALNKNDEIVFAKEPLHFYEPLLTGLDCGLSFGKELLEHVPDSIAILLIPVAVGGSGINQWIGDSIFRNVQLFSNFKEKVQVGKEYGIIKGILWLQGENDATNDKNISLYKNRLSILLKKFRETIDNENLPVVIGELGQNDDKVKKINNQIKLYILSDSNSSLVKTSDLKKKEDKVHFNSEGLRILGQRFAIEYMKAFGNRQN